MLWTEAIMRDSWWIVTSSERPYTEVNTRICENKLRHQHDMSVSESFRQAVKLRKELFAEVWPNYVVIRANSDNDTEEYTDEVEEEKWTRKNNRTCWHV